MADRLARHFVRGVFMLAGAASVSILGGEVFAGMDGGALRTILSVFGILVAAPLGIIGAVHVAISGLLAFGFLTEGDV